MNKEIQSINSLNSENEKINYLIKFGVENTVSDELSLLTDVQSCHVDYALAQTTRFNLLFDVFHPNTTKTNLHTKHKI